MTGLDPIIFRLTKLGSASALYRKGKFPIALFSFSNDLIQDANSSFVPLSINTPPINRLLIWLKMVSLLNPKRPTAGISNCATIAVSSIIKKARSTSLSKNLFSDK